LVVKFDLERSERNAHAHTSRDLEAFIHWRLFVTFNISDYE